MHNEPPDDELVAATLGGDRAAFEALLDRHVDRVRLLAARMLQPEDAEDVVQEALLQAFLGLDRLRNPERFGSWLYGITLNLARMRLRRRDPLVLDAGVVEGPAADGVTALDAVREALDVLPRREREAVLLHYVEGLAQNEVVARRRAPGNGSGPAPPRPPTAAGAPGGICTDDLQGGSNDRSRSGGRRRPDERRER